MPGLAGLLVAAGLAFAWWQANATPRACGLVGFPEEGLLVGVAPNGALPDRPARVDVCVDDRCEEGVDVLGLGAPVPSQLRATFPASAPAPSSVTLRLVDASGSVSGTWRWSGSSEPADYWVNGRGCPPHARQLWFAAQVDGSLRAVDPPGGR